MPQDAGRVVHKTFPAPAFGTDGAEPGPGKVPCQLQGRQFFPVPVCIVYLYKDHRVVDPAGYISILQVKGDRICVEYGEAGIQDRFRKAQVPVKTAGDFKVAGADKRPD